MGVPVNETVHIRLHAADVIHSFYVPQFFYKMDVVPGRINEFEVDRPEPGTYGGQCAEFCGLAHADMYFTVQAMTGPTSTPGSPTSRQGSSATAEPSQPAPPPGAATVAGLGGQRHGRLRPEHADAPRPTSR